jgi:serine phosphatase RsbU (regulator of sigma subunit)/DNA-binding NarL/FixJ family response regulator
MPEHLVLLRGASRTAPGPQNDFLKKRAGDSSDLALECVEFYAEKKMKIILIVEDEPLVAMELKENLERKGYCVPDVLDSGEEVGPAVARLHPDLVLMDIRLKGKLDGVQAASLAKLHHDIPVIFLTAYSDMDTLNRAASVNPEAFLLKPFDEQELFANIHIALSREVGDDDPLRRELYGAMSMVDALEDPAMIVDRAGKIARVNVAAARLLNLGDPAELERVSLSRIMDLPENPQGPRCDGLKMKGSGTVGVVASIERLLRADGREYGSLVLFSSMEKRESRLLETSAAQANSALINLLPASDALGPGYRVLGFLDPSPSGSGDLFGVFAVGAGKAAFYSLDVMGHGIIAALMAFSLHDILMDMGGRGAAGVLPPTDVLKALYKRYYGRSAIAVTFFTIDYGVLDPGTGEYCVVRGGHTPVLHLDAKGGMKIHQTKGTAVGVMADADVEEARDVLLSGDRLLLASDGLLEAFGGEGLNQALANLAAFSDGLSAASLEDFVKAVRDYSRERLKDHRMKDDVSLLVIERE